jgi:hypothetical protein
LWQRERKNALAIGDRRMNRKKYTALPAHTPPKFIRNGKPEKEQYPKTNKPPGYFQTSDW